MLINTNLYNESTDNVFSYINQINNNYNAIIEAARISELRYYQDTGNSLFITESGIFTKLLDTIIKFFKSIIEKLKSLFNKSSSETKKKEKTIEKQKKEIEEKTKNEDDWIDFEFDMWPFKNLFESGVLSNRDADKRSEPIVKTAKVMRDGLNDIDPSQNADQARVNVYKIEDKEAKINENRAQILSGIIDSSEIPLNDKERQDAIMKFFTGEKEKATIDKSTYEKMSHTDKDKSLEKENKYLQDQIKVINDCIKVLEETKRKASKILDENPNITDANNNHQPMTKERKEEIIKIIQDNIDIIKAASLDLTSLSTCHVASWSLYYQQCIAIGSIEQKLINKKLTQEQTLYY